jgi:hypothetical protein
MAYFSDCVFAFLPDGRIKATEIRNRKVNERKCNFQVVYVSGQ